MHTGAIPDDVLPADRTRWGPRPLVIAHRGGAGHRPEHTLAGYELAARMGADILEPDLVATKDGVLVVRHENDITQTTDVAGHPEFAARRTTRSIDGVVVTGWFTEDLTLAELKTLRATERIPRLRPANTAYDRRFAVPTFREVVALAARLSEELRRGIGVGPELKHPTYFRSIGLPLDERLVAALEADGLNAPDAGVLVQCFEPGELQRLRPRVRVPLVQLTAASGAPYDLAGCGDARGYADLMTPTGLAEIATYADALGPAKESIVPRATSGSSSAPTSLVDDAHAAGLAVYPYTFRDENAFLPRELRSSADPAARGDAPAEYARFFALGVDGVFSDHPDTAVAARGESGP